MSSTESKAQGATPELFQNPYSFYRANFEKDPMLPMQFLDGVDCVYVTGHQETEAVLKDPRFVRQIDPFLPEEQRGKWNGRNMEIPESFGPLLSMQKNWMLFTDNPLHSHLRSPVTKAFTPAVTERLRPKMEEIANFLLDELKGKETIDLLADYAFVLPVIVIAELLGIPAEDREKFKAWSSVLARTMEPMATEQEMLAGALVAKELMEYFRVIVQERRVEPRHDLISDLVKSDLTEDELLATCVLLLLAGHETTVNLICNGVYNLLKHPEQLEKLRNDPDLYPSAVEEILRYESPVAMTLRMTSEDLEMGGHQIGLGTPIYLVLAAANRDPRQFENPDVFDITRTPNRHLAFAVGPHFCVGANLARVEGQIALRVLFDRMKEIELIADGVEWRTSVSFRGLKALPVYGKID